MAKTKLMAIELLIMRYEVLRFNMHFENQHDFLMGSLIQHIFIEGLPWASIMLGAWDSTVSETKIPTLTELKI